MDSLKETSEGLVIMCVDPEAVCGSCVVLQVFPRKSKFSNYAISDQLLADMDSPFENDAHKDSAHESAAADSEFVKFGYEAIVNAYSQKVCSSDIDLMPGRAKTWCSLQD